jgi:DNA-binding NarL/FixJ family response regulator
MNGIELYRQLEIERPEVVNRFIFTTGDTLSGNIKTFLEETERAYLPKPFAPENLRAIVKTVFVAI